MRACCSSPFCYLVSYLLRRLGQNLLKTLAFARLPVHSALIVWLLPAGGLFAQPWSAILSPTRAIDWSQAGVIGGIPNRTTVCSTLSPGATAAQINTAITNCPSGQVVFLNAGTYNLSAGIVFNNKSNVTLRGAGPDKTFLIFSNGGSCAGWGGSDVCFMTADTGDGGDGNYSNAATWTGGYNTGSTSITLGGMVTGNISNLQVGSQIFLDQSDDTSDTGQVFVCQTSACSTELGSGNGRSGRGQQQPVIVTSISGSGPWTVGISPGIRMPNIASGKSPQAWWDNGLPIQNDGIEDLSMDHTVSNGTAGIWNGSFVLNGYNIWFKDIRDIQSDHKHDWLYQSSHVTVRDSYFWGAAHATSESYGVDTFNGADNLTENCIFQHLAFPMMLEGCIGCVGAYNYNLDDYYTGTPQGSATDWQQAGEYHHGVGDAFFLWEGNQGIGMTNDDIHGTSNFVTAFRNYFNGRDPAGGSNGGKTSQTSAVILNSYNRYYNIIGNVLGTAGYHTKYTDSPPDSTNCNLSVYAVGWGGNCASGSVPNDNLTLTTLMRWGNYDVVNNAVRFVASEVPSVLSLFANPVPLLQALPASFYLSSQPSWWSTPWGTPAWPAIGPDVSSGNIANIGGHANQIPAALCYGNSPIDSNYGSNNVRLFNASNCYGSTGQKTVLPPTNLQVTVH